MSNQQKRTILSFLFLVLMVLAIAAFAVAASLNSDVSVDFEVGIAPQELVISNVTQNGFTVSWVSQEAEQGLVKYGLETTLLATTAIDFRGEESSTLHYVRITDLDPATTYYFEIYSGNTVFKNNNLYFSQSTLGNEASLGTPESITLTLPETFTEGIIYAYASNGIQTSTIASSIASSNSALIDVSTLRDPTTQELFDLTLSQVRIHVTSDQLLRAVDTLAVGQQDLTINELSSETSAFLVPEVFAVDLPTPIEEPEEEEPVEEDIVEEDPRVIEEEPIAQNPAPVIIPQQLPPASQQPVVVANSSPLPSTAISTGELLIGLSGLGLLVVGIALKKNSSL